VVVAGTEVHGTRNLDGGTAVAFAFVLLNRESFVFDAPVGRGVFSVVFGVAWAFLSFGKINELACSRRFTGCAGRSYCGIVRRLGISGVFQISAEFH
jgi:hypothetical protein